MATKRPRIQVELVERVHDAARTIESDNAYDRSFEESLKVLLDHIEDNDPRQDIEALLAGDDEVETFDNSPQGPAFDDRDGFM